MNTEERIKMKLAEHGLALEFHSKIVGNSVALYRYEPSVGIKMSKIELYTKDIEQVVEVSGVRVLAPIPESGLVGFEVPLKHRTFPEGIPAATGLNIPIGVNVVGDNIIAPLDEMPHLLIAGATGSGKSILLHSILTSLSRQMSAEELKLILIDPKRVELAAFSHLPHLLYKPIYEYEDSLKALLKLVDEMDGRYKILERAGKRDIASFNASKRDPANKLPYIVMVIDEFADLMLRAESMAGKEKSYGSHSKGWLIRQIVKRLGDGMAENYLGATKAEMIECLENLDSKDEMKRSDANVEFLIVRLAQMARAVGIHLIIATQRPSVDVITGLIKANFPTRIALTVASPTDSIVILGVPGAEKLNNKGDLLFMSPSARSIQRLQGYHP